MPPFLRSHITSDVGGLRVWWLKDQLPTERLSPEGASAQLFNCIAAIISLALGLLQSDSGVLALTKITELLCKDDFMIGFKVLEYFHAIKKSFPHVIITNRYGMNGDFGRINTREWEGAFDPKSAAVIAINESLMLRLAHASSNPYTHRQSFRCHLFLLAITMAHELTHLYTHFILGPKCADTPPAVTYRKFGTKDKGESGWKWESLVFGGMVEMWTARSHQSNPGKETMAMRDIKDRVWPIKAAMIEGILQRDFTKWLGPGKSLDDAKASGERFNEPMSRRKWDKDFSGVISHSSKGELPDELVDWLTGPGVADLPKYDIDAPDLIVFAIHPSTMVRVTESD